MHGPCHLSPCPSSHTDTLTGVMRFFFKYFVYFHGENESCDLLVHLKPIKDLLALIKWHHFKG